MALTTSLTGLNGAQAELTVLSNNIANAGTTGFKRSRVEFADIVAASPLQDLRRIVGAGTSVRGVVAQMTQGPVQTGLGGLDLAIDGAGMFAVRAPDSRSELRFTRAGAFAVDAARFVVDGDGRRLQVLPVDPSGAATASGVGALQPLRLPRESIPPGGGPAARLDGVAIADDGLVSATWSDGRVAPLARVALAGFANPAGLRPVGGAGYAVTGASGPAEIGEPGLRGLGALRAGALERANVDITDELVGLITAQRNFQANAKALETGDAMMQTVIGIRG